MRRNGRLTIATVPSAVIVASANAASSRLASLTDSMADDRGGAADAGAGRDQQRERPRDAEDAADQQRRRERQGDAAEDHDDRAQTEIADRAEAQADAEQGDAEAQHVARGVANAGGERRPQEAGIGDHGSDREGPDERTRAGDPVSDAIGHDDDDRDERQTRNEDAGALSRGVHHPQVVAGTDLSACA